MSFSTNALSGLNTSLQLDESRVIEGERDGNRRRSTTFRKRAMSRRYHLKREVPNKEIDKIKTIYSLESLTKMIIQSEEATLKLTKIYQ